MWARCCCLCCCTGGGEGLACTGRTGVFLLFIRCPARPDDGSIADVAPVVFLGCTGRPRTFRALPSSAAGMPSPASSPSCIWLCFCLTVMNKKKRANRSDGGEVH